MDLKPKVVCKAVGYTLLQTAEHIDLQSYGSSNQ